MPRKKVAAAVALSLLLCLSLRAETLPESLTDDAFWKLIESISEPGGAFNSDNFISNELGYGAVLPALRQASQPNAVLIGVGPEQNFTFVAALQPKIAFIVDIRRENMLQHLMYKAVFELSSNRAEFVSRLFSRKLTKEVAVSASGTELLESLEATPSDKARHEENTKQILDVLIKKHEFGLNESDLKSIRYIHDSFFQFGPAINYNSGALSSGKISTPGSRMPNYIEILTATPQAAAGNFLANESAYAVVREMEMKNRIVPVTGDFGGSRAIRAIGRWLEEHDARVTAFYTSNVEGYLFTTPRRGAAQNSEWNNFIANLRALPTDASSFIIRTVGRNLATRLPAPAAGFIDPLATAPIHKLLDAVDNGQIREYADLFQQR